MQNTCKKSKVDVKEIYKETQIKKSNNENDPSHDREGNVEEIKKKETSLSDQASEINLNKRKGIWGDERRIRGKVFIPEGEMRRFNGLLAMRTGANRPKFIKGIQDKMK